MYFTQYFNTTTSKIVIIVDGFTICRCSEALIEKNLPFLFIRLISPEVS